MNSPIQILIADDHIAVREGLRLLLEAEPDMTVVGEADDGRSAIEMALELQPDIVLMDISMPGLDGLKATAKLKRVAPQILILTLTRHTDEAYMKELFEAGASGYVLKQSSSAELTRAIRAVLAGDNFIDSAMMNKVFVDYSKRTVKGGDTSGFELTPKEETVLHYVALGYSNREIAEKLGISLKTVEAAKLTALKRLKISTRREIVQYAFLKGWMADMQ